MLARSAALTLKPPKTNFVWICAPQGVVMSRLTAVNWKLLSLGSIGLVYPGMEINSAPISEQINELYRLESRRILATLIRLLGDFDLAEDALQDAFRAALEQWPNEGVPSNPRAWLISAGRFKAIDMLRRRVRFDASQSAITEQLYSIADAL